MKRWDNWKKVEYKFQKNFPNEIKNQLTFYGLKTCHIETNNCKLKEKGKVGKGQIEKVNGL